MAIFQNFLRRAALWMIVGCSFLTYSSIAQAPIDIRVALVIGNAAYRNVPALNNPTNDARAMANVLRKLGFQVIELVDGTKSQMEQAIERLQSLLKGRQAVGMLYYAGHGLQLDWHNYMVPVDAKLNQAVDVSEQTVDIERVINTFRKVSTRMNIIVLDACRDNPFSGKASGRGLAQLDAPPGTYLAFSTAPGNVAEDGDEASGNGLFTQYLLKELQKPAQIEDVFKRVRLQVRQKSQGRQIPWDSSSLEDNFAFNDGVKYTFNPEDEFKQAQAQKLETKLKLDAEMALQAAEEARRKTLSQEEAKARQFAQEKADWDKIKDSKNPDDFYAFLNKFPNGLISQQATFLLESLAKAKITAQADKNGIKQAMGEPRFRMGDSYVMATIDDYTGREIKRESARVTKIEAGLVYIDGDGGAETRTLDGAVVRINLEGGSTFDPPRIDLPGDELILGKKWLGRTIQSSNKFGTFWREESFKIVGFEEITIPAGTFKAFKIQSSGIHQFGGRIDRTYWVEPGWGISLKSTRVIKSPRGNTTRETMYLISRTRENA